jgi:starch-binding outer membrane protein, SusD/RagB family
MFKKYSLYVLGTLCLLFGACNVLEQEPEGSLTPDLAFSDEKAARSAVNGLYSALQSGSYYGGVFQFNADNFADISRFAGFTQSFQEADQKTISVQNGNVAGFWGAAYRAISIANEIIDRVPEVPGANFTDEERNALVAEAKCIRALCYLDLLTYFGEHWDSGSRFGLPLISESTGGDFANVTFPRRNSVAETYAFILKDLRDAKAVLPDSDERFKATKGLASGLLVRTALYQKDYTTVISEANELLQNTNFSLVPNYGDIFANDLSEESVFELVFTPLDPSSLAFYCLRRDEVRPESGLISSFQTGDTRKALIGPFTGTVGQRFLKYESNSDDANPAYVMRIAEIYLARAEAQFFSNNLPAALADLNAVHTRAGLPLYTTTDNFAQKLADEARWEFFAEGQRMRALVRLGLAESVLSIDAFRRIYPIPFSQLNFEENQIEQNPGY